MKKFLCFYSVFSTILILTSCSQNKVDAAEATLPKGDVLELSGTTWISIPNRNTPELAMMLLSDGSVEACVLQNKNQQQRNHGKWARNNSELSMKFDNSKVNYQIIQHNQHELILKSKGKLTRLLSADSKNTNTCVDTLIEEGYAIELSDNDKSNHISDSKFNNKQVIPAILTGTANCIVDSTKYSVAFQPKSGKLLKVPLKDGTLITIKKRNGQVDGITIDNKNLFRRCQKSTGIINNKSQAKAILKYTSIKELDSFVGAELFLCQTADEGWFFFYHNAMGYVGYAGPYESPLALVGMTCDG